MNPESSYIVHPLGEIAPQTGMFQIKRGKDFPLRALSVVFKHGLWVVFMDGSAVAPASSEWQEAFGNLCREDMLIGTRINFDEYTRLLAARLQDRMNGRNLEVPIDRNLTPPAF